MDARQPTPDEQIQFLRYVQRLFAEGSFVASHKLALLRVLADLAVASRAIAVEPPSVCRYNGGQAARTGPNCAPITDVPRYNVRGPLGGVTGPVDQGNVGDAEEES
ncbi:MAG TPA: hypothetical protein P5572_04585 [Phycisphaerae bacterium]|nr:hypothetical protein [Phycisphaerae bacterium]